MKNAIIQAADLFKLKGQENLILVDASQGPNAKTNYLSQHLEGAVYVDLDTDLADIKADFADGGRHPLPSLSQFSNTLNDLGISPSSHVVVYDDKGGANAAARFWWMLNAIGHKNVQVLNGGMLAAVSAGFLTSSDITKKTAESTYQIIDWQSPTVEIDFVENVAQNPDYLVIDVRDAARYRGETEPIDLVAGHIPGAVNVPLTGNLDENGLFLSPEILRKKYEEVINGRPLDKVIVHCGSGVTACHSILAMVSAGFEIPKLYVGSWSEWSRNGKEIGIG
ncbi:sulfurtransferase [Lacihabitans sp. LS3-19]|uniref:sulfurtransferase n=1 Tax=Lacihabitans sp. LS3-19 TaxID=2487335 RepID=UPI0020CDBDF8|nr:sulfurtransferase [Lacihabitans sp. LS3-19]MCP9769636.1 sulfurtransferase [Lacihabitans sp. LS3-19]